MSAQFSLEIIEGAQIGKTIPFKKAAATIGRKAAGNDLILNNQTVSGQHARISCRDGQYFLEDLGSTNQTLLNGSVVPAHQRVSLKNGDKLQLGNIGLRFLEGARSAKKADPAKPMTAERITQSADDRQSTRFKSLFRLLRKRIVMCSGAVAVVLVSLLVLKLFSNRFDMAADPAAGAPDLSAQPIALPAPGAYGYTGASDNSHPDRAIFTFVAKTGRARITYTPGAIDTDGEVVIRLNDQPLGNVPLATGGWGDEQVLRLEKEMLVAGGENRLEFDNTLNPPGKQMWGVKDLRIAFLPAASCDLTEGRRLFDLAENMYAEKAISAGNLFRAVRYYTQASASADACEPKPEYWPTLAAKLGSAEKELEARYKNLRFSYLKKIQLNQYLSARKDLEAMLLLIPDTNDSRHKNAATLLRRLNQILDGQG